MNRDKIGEAIEKHLQGQVALHKANVEVYMTNVVGIGDHPNIMEAIEKELSEISKYEGMLSALRSIFINETKY